MNFAIILRFIFTIDSCHTCNATRKQRLYGVKDIELLDLNRDNCDAFYIIKKVVMYKMKGMIYKHIVYITSL